MIFSFLASHSSQINISNFIKKILNIIILLVNYLNIRMKKIFLLVKNIKTILCIHSKHGTTLKG